MALVLLAVGLVVLVVGAEVLVRGAGHLATTLGISPLVVGLTVVAFGTSAPEMAVGVQAATDGRTELALGNVVGSNIFNTFAILGVSALLTPLVVHQKLVRREAPLVVGAAVAVTLMALDGRLGRLDGLLLLAGAIGYTAWAVVTERREAPEVVEEYTKEYGADDAADGAGRHWGVDIILLIAGLGLLVLGSRWLVDGAVDIAEALGLSEMVIGLTIVAAGTSLPEAATSVVAGLRGERDIAVGNAIGSNLFNLLAVLGLTSAVAPDGVPAPHSALAVELPVLVGAAVICLAVFYTGWTISRLEGALLSGLYLLYLAHLLLDANDHGALAAFRILVLGGVLPVMAVVLATQAARQRRLRVREAVPA